MDQFSPQVLSSDQHSQAWHALEADEVLRHLEAPGDQGLSAEQAQARLQQFGPNALKEATTRSRTATC